MELFAVTFCAGFVAGVLIMLVLIACIRNAQISHAAEERERREPQR
jgi:hypothetical protein